MAVSNGARKFRAFLKKRSLSQSAVARLLGASQPAIHYWIVGASTPGEAARRDIEELTGGDVAFDDWEPKDRRPNPPRKVPNLGSV